MLPIIAVGASAVALAVIKTRPSTLLRVAEDGIASSGKAIARTAKRFTRNVRVEMDARQLARATQRVKDEEVRVLAMTKAQRKAYDADVAAIMNRARELSAKRVKK